MFFSRFFLAFSHWCAAGRVTLANLLALCCFSHPVHIYIRAFLRVYARTCTMPHVVTWRPASYGFCAFVNLFINNDIYMEKKWYLTCSTSVGPVITWPDFIWAFTSKFISLFFFFLASFFSIFNEKVHSLFFGKFWNCQWFFELENLNRF